MPADFGIVKSMQMGRVGKLVILGAVLIGALSLLVAVLRRQSLSSAPARCTFAIENAGTPYTVQIGSQALFEDFMQALSHCQAGRLSLYKGQPPASPVSAFRIVFVNEPQPSRFSGPDGLPIYTYNLELDDQTAVLSLQFPDSTINSPDFQRELEYALYFQVGASLYGPDWLTAYGSPALSKYWQLERQGLTLSPATAL